MKRLDRLERRLGHLAVNNLTLLLIIGQSICFILAKSQPSFVSQLSLSFNHVLDGQVWRLVSFMLIPADLQPIFFIIELYLFYIFGTALEAEWGDFRFNLYIFIAYVASIIASAIIPASEIDNSFIIPSIFFAFAFVYPDYELLLFFVLPTKIKYLAWFAWGGYALTFCFGNLTIRLSLLAGISNFIFFFATDFLDQYRLWKRRRRFFKK